MKKEFIEFIEALMAAAPDVANEKMTDGIQQYLNTLKGAIKEKPELTDNGKMVLDYMQKHQDTTAWQAKDIADGMFVASRTVSGAMRKLVTDGFVEKMSDEPVIYTLTEKGKNYKID